MGRERPWVGRDTSVFKPYDIVSKKIVTGGGMTHIPPHSPSGYVTAPTDPFIGVLLVGPMSGINESEQ